MVFLLAFGYFTALTGLFLAKLLPLWNLAIPGGLEDTRIFLWNAWWFHHAITVLHTNPFHTSMLFFPFGSQLISHDFPLWMSLVTFLGQQAGLSMIASSNLWFALSWILLGFCVFGLAREVTRSTSCALAAGTMAMTHSYILARAMQNWGQFNAWSIALFLWCLIYARRSQKQKWFGIAGLALAWNAACHYYFLIYGALIWIAVAAVDISPTTWHFSYRPNFPGKTRRILLGLSFTALLIALGISFHPGIYLLAGHTVRMQSSVNPLMVMWLLLMAWGATHLQLKNKSSSPAVGNDAIKNHLTLAFVTFLLLSPLIGAALKLALSGGYPKQSILWKTHLQGANLLSLFMPNPLNAFWGSAVSRWFFSRGMNPQEQAASIGWVCLAVVLLAQVWKESRQAKRWLFLAGFATVLAMGTHLHINQYNLWCPLPFFWLRLLPIVGNVRVPERWMAMGAIAWSIVLAIALKTLSDKKKWPIWKVSLSAIIFLLLENWPGFPIRPIPAVPTVYERLKALPEGAVLPVPLYIGDSSIGTGNALERYFIFPWDHLWAQVIHEKPILGGFVGRISRRLIENYKADPFIKTLLDLEENKIPSESTQPAAGLRAIKTFRFRYVLVYPQATEEAVLNYVFGSLPLELIDKTEIVQLYQIKDYRSD